MAMSFVAADHRSATANVGARLQDIFAGAICGVLSTAYCLSYAALIFSGPLAQWLGYGIAVTFLSAAIGGAVVALRSSLHFTIAGPESSAAAVLAALVAGLLHRLAADGAGADIIKPALIMLALGTALTGILLLGLGVTRAGRAIRFVPYPVIGGFLGATGWLIIIGAVQVTVDRPPALESLPALFDGHNSSQLLAAAATALALFVGQRHLRSAFALPGLLFAGIAVSHLALLSFGIPLAQAQADGWMFSPQPVAGLAFPWHLEDLRSFRWAALLALSGDLFAVMFVTAITVLLNTTGIELATRKEADLDRELSSHGLANLLTAAFGGYISCVSVSRSTLAYSAGATSRLAGITVAAMSAAVIAFDPAFLGYVPKCVLGGLLLYFGLDLLHRWLLVSWRRLAPIEYLSLLAIAVIIILWGFVAGLLIGVVIGCAAFALSASRVNAIKFTFDGSEYHSSLDRGPQELAILAEHGHELQGMSLQSYLFFGSANRLYEHIKALLARRSGCRFLLFDFRLVTGIDSSATNSFTQIKQAADACGAQLVLVNMTREVQDAFRSIRLASTDTLVVGDLDRALELCEDAIIDAYRAPGSETRTLREWLGKVLDAEHAEYLAQRCERLEVAAGEVIARQGDPADSMHFILEGRVSVVVDVGSGRIVRVRSLGPHTTIGEMGLISGRARSATIKAEVASVLYVLTGEAFARIRTGNPAMYEALLSYVITVMSERLSFASRVIGVLQR
jgi:SulP family sulfate permease